jgi:hypothetical protein
MGKISEYPVTATGINAGDLFDISIDNGDGTFTSAKLPGSVLTGLLTGGLNLGTANLTQTDATRTYDGDNNDLVWTDLKSVVFNSIAGGVTFNSDVAINQDLSANGSLITGSDIRELGVQTINSSPATGAVNRSIYAVDTSSGAITVNLPNAASVTGIKITIFDYQGNAAMNHITIDADGSQTINGQLTQQIDSNYGWCILYSDGSNWRLLRPDLNGSGLGWASYEDSAFLATTVANTPLRLTFGKPVALETQIPEGITTYWETTGHTIPGKLNDGISVQLSFDAEPLANNLHLDVWLDLGGSIGIIYPQTFSFAKGSGVVTKIVYNLSSLYQLSTWVANGAEIWVESNGAVEITKPKLNVHRNYKG